MASHDSPSEEATENQNAKIQFRFCRECSNMLYPREDKESNTLIFQCRNCQWPTQVGATCIYRNELSGNVTETAGVVADVASDPTVGDCIPDICTLCGQEIVCISCGQPTDCGVCLEVEDEPEPSASAVAEEKEEREHKSAE